MNASRGISTQSDGSELGCSEGYEHVLTRLAAFPPTLRSGRFTWQTAPVSAGLSVSNNAHASPVLPPESPVTSHFHETQRSPCEGVATACALKSFWPGWSSGHSRFAFGFEQASSFLYVKLGGFASVM